MKLKKKNCEAKTPFCSNKAIAHYGVNGSEKKKKFFQICLPCMTIMRLEGTKFKQI